MNYVADFETTTRDDDCRVWGWGMCMVPDDWKSLELGNVEIGGDLDSFIDAISELNTTCYFHNLRFDGKFILDWLLKHGYDHVTSRGNISAGQFKSLIDDMGTFYSITVRWFDGHLTEFRDSFKKLTMSVREVANAFHLENSKGEIDYELERPIGWKITADEADYIRRDVWIVAKALGQQLAQGFTKLTVGADALFEYRKLIGNDKYRYLFPAFSFSMDAEIRRAYRGGFTYADPRYSGVRQGHGIVLDVNSLYPSVMYYKALPYGEPEYVDGYVESTDKRPLTIFSVTFTARLKPGHIPCIQVKGNSRFAPTEYLDRLDEPTNLVVTNVDWELINDHYEVTVHEYAGGWRFTAANGMFDTYIDKWMRIKAHSTGGMRALAKLQLNSLYGKFATNPILGSKYPVLDDEGKVQLKRGLDDERNPVYTAAGVFITSYARDVTIRSAQANYAHFAYADTDSLHLLDVTRPPDSIRVHESELGAWKHEYDFDAAHYIRAKAYFERTSEGRFHNAVAGVPTHISGALTFEHLNPGQQITVTHAGEQVSVTSEPWQSPDSVLIHGKLTPRTVPGGVVLKATPYELKLW